jgi:hypothetical protein
MRLVIDPFPSPTLAPTATPVPNPTSGPSPTATPTPRPPFLQNTTINYVEFSLDSNQTIPGDTDSDGDVDLVDYQTLLDEFNTTNCGGSCVADFDNDGSITIFDFNVVVTHFGQ